MADGWVRVEKRRYPRQPRATWEARVVGDDDFGLWLYAPAGQRNRHSMSGIQLLARERWWVAWWWDDPAGWWCAADIATPAAVQDGVWAYDDLEIDVVGNQAGFLTVVDEDEFEEARARVPYPTAVAQAALSARDEVVRGMRSLEEPFGSCGWDRLRAALDEAGQ